MALKNASSKSNPFTRLAVWYVLALSTIAIIMLSGQWLIQRHLGNQLNDSHVVNVAGRQRMLSQKIVKNILLLQEQNLNSNALDELKKSVRLWEVAQHGLVNGNDSLHLPSGNSEEVLRLFAKANSHFKLMDSAVRVVVSSFSKAEPVQANSSRAIEIILREEPEFLTDMEAIVFQFDSEARQKVSLLSQLEYLLMAISLAVIVLEILFIFRPTALQVNLVVNKLLTSEKDSKKMSNEIRDLYASLEKSYEQITHINLPVENPRVFAKSDRGGNVTFIAPAFSATYGKLESDRLQLGDLFYGMKNRSDWMDGVIDTVSEEKIWKGEIKFQDATHRECWAVVTVIPVLNDAGAIEELVMMGSDITKRKQAEQNINLKTQAEIDKRINQQKYRSVLILEGQEEERKRIAMDIHDGIGQMLTSLKYQVESIDTTKGNDVSHKLHEIDLLIKQLIKEVRKVTFNLRPTVLGDYGLQSALSVFVNEMTKLIDMKLEFHCDVEISRLPQKVENNIFRIIQEAINNSIKYSGASKIDVSLTEVANELVVEVKDDGRGFDTRLVDERNVNFESGRGLFNMYERSEYVNGTLQVTSQPGAGTTVRFTVPVSAAAYIETEI